MRAMKGKVVFYVATACLAAVIAIAFFSQDKVPESGDPDAEVSVPEENHDLILNQVNHVATRDGKTEWTLDADSAQYDRASGKTMFKAVDATFFLEEGEKVHLTGKDGVLMSGTKDMEVSGSVVVRSGPYVLNTEQLTYKHSAKIVSTDSPVKIEGDLLHVTGDSMVFDLGTDRLVVSGGVKAVFDGFTM
jgi:LPS export ABC transporter protein LptC